jgi:hypothetical protein
LRRRRIEAHKLLSHDDVGRARHRKEFGKTLHYGQDDYFQEGHWACL